LLASVLVITARQFLIYNTVIAHLFHLLKNSQEVASKDIGHVLFGPIPSEQFLDEDRILGNIF